MGFVTITGAMIIVIAWVALVEFDSYTDAKRKKVVTDIKNSPFYMFLVSLMPLGIVINLLGSFFNLVWLINLGTFLIFLQGFIIALIFWERKRYKSIVLFTIIIILVIFIYIPLLF